MSKNNTPGANPEDFMRERVRTARKDFKAAQDKLDYASYRRLSTEVDDAETALSNYIEVRDAEPKAPRRLPIKTKKSEGVTSSAGRNISKASDPQAGSAKVQAE